MSSCSPLFSIVIPTRNRAHLLPHALRSALNQDFDDFEIVVVANDCKDNTREVVKSMANNRVHYFETDKMLTMPENWEYAWTKARGKYVLYLCDDDALVPSALKLIKENALESEPAVISWEDAIYYYPNWNDPKLQNLLLLFFFGNTLVEDVPSVEMQNELKEFRFKWSSPIPKLLNCAVNRMFFEEWRKRLERLFFPVAPDYSFAWISTQVCSFIRVLHYPLSVRGISDYSIGSNAGLGSAGQSFLEEFGEFDFFAETENSLPLSINHLAATFSRVNVALAKIGIKPQLLDSGAFNVALAKQLLECRHLLPSWDHHLSTFRENSKKFSSSIYNQINAILSTKIEESKNSESLRDLHKRTQKMALEHPPHLDNAIKKYSGDSECARCSLAMSPEILADSNWKYAYLFGEELNSYDIYSMSTHIDHYYNLLFKCNKKLTQFA